MRFRGLLQSKKAGKRGIWLRDAHHSGLYAMQQFARISSGDVRSRRPRTFARTDVAHRGAFLSTEIEDESREVVYFRGTVVAPVLPDQLA